RVAVAMPDDSEAARGTIGEIGPQHRLDQTENCRRRANAQGHDQCHRQKERRILEKQSRSLSDTDRRHGYFFAPAAFLKSTGKFIPSWAHDPVIVVPPVFTVPV